MHQERPLRLLLEGRPGIGKTTVARRLVALLRDTGVPLGGFVTDELRRGGQREGFAVHAVNTGHHGVLAHVELPGPPRVGRYGVDLQAFERVALPAITAPPPGGWSWWTSLGRWSSPPRPSARRVGAAGPGRGGGGHGRRPAPSVHRCAEAASRPAHSAGHRAEPRLPARAPGGRTCLCRRRGPSPVTRAARCPGGAAVGCSPGVLDRNQVRDQDGELARLAARAGNPRAAVVLVDGPSCDLTLAHVMGAALTTYRR
jgi:NTP hydrolase family protein